MTLESANGTDLVEEGLNEEDEHLTPFEWYFYVFNGLIGSVLNLAVLLIGLLHTDTHDKPRQLIVINMTFADLVTCLVYMLTRPYLNHFPMGTCYPYYVTIFTSQLCSCLNLLWLNVDKLVYIKFPLHYYTLVSRPKVMLLTILSWISLLSLGMIIYTFMSVKNPCNAVQISPLIYLPVCVFYVLMILASFIISAVIYCIAHNSRRMEAQARSRLFQRLFFVFSSTLWTFVTCLPYRLLYLTNALCIPCQSELFYRLTDTFFSILVLGIVINPLITIVTQRLYRQCVILYFHKLLQLLALSNSSGNSRDALVTNRRLSRSKSTTTAITTTSPATKKSNNNLLVAAKKDGKVKSDLKEVTLLNTAINCGAVAGAANTLQTCSLQSCTFSITIF